MLLDVELVDPNGIKIKTMQIPSRSDGTFTVDEFKIPSNAIIGLWKINVSSGSNLDKVEFEVIATNKDAILIELGEKIEIPGYGEAIKIGIVASQKTSITMQVYTLNNIQVGEPLSCVPTAEFKCEILWTIPKDIVPGTHIVRISDSIVTEETIFEIK